MTDHPELPIWIGMVDVRPDGASAPFADAPGAFTNAITEAQDEADYRWRVDEFFRSMDLAVVGFKDVEPLEKRRKHFAVPEPVLALAELARTNHTITYDTFYIYRCET